LKKSFGKDGSNFKWVLASHFLFIMQAVKWAKISYAASYFATAGWFGLSSILILLRQGIFIRRWRLARVLGEVWLCLLAQMAARPIFSWAHHFFFATGSKLVRLEANGSAAIFRSGCHMPQNLPTSAAGQAQMFKWVISFK
jgi:hypothetical protein